MSSKLLFVFRRADRRARCPAGALRDEHQGGADPDDEGLPAWPERVWERAHLAVAGGKPTLNFKDSFISLDYKINANAGKLRGFSVKIQI